MVYKPRDSYYRKAKREGYLSRAAYKLIELQERFRIIRPGDRVVDLGAAPGGWLQVASRLAGPHGKVVGIDLQPIGPLGEENVVTLQGDVTSEESLRQITRLLGGLADCVLSDLSPKLTGVRDTDEARCLELNRAALGAALRLLRPGGSFLVKSFVSAELETFAREIKNHFQSVQRTRPEATRRGSSEIYFFARGFLPTVASSTRET
ncbi:MAG TPA: RlmE family RNA methyltransferase [candidate division Zixibacteria bacterium]|nr:RlmE family RNA methyltransferase [candidate division Zixibacteria bacterium]